MLEKLLAEGVRRAVPEFLTGNRALSGELREDSRLA
jgi:hypothetical protein